MIAMKIRGDGTRGDMEIVAVAGNGVVIARQGEERVTATEREMGDTTLVENKTRIWTAGLIGHRGGTTPTTETMNTGTGAAIARTAMITDHKEDTRGSVPAARESRNSIEKSHEDHDRGKDDGVKVLIVQDMETVRHD
jgi:hypothetical protein